MLRRVPLRPGKGFQRKRPEGPTSEREPRPMSLVPATRRATYAGETAGPVGKERPVRSAAYRRLVAAMPCCFCKVQGHSQAAHPNAGKGAGLKTDDRLCFPLCADGPGIEGCHPRFDQYRLLASGRDEHAAYGERWGEQTRAAILAAGTWPASLPRWKEA